MKPYKIHSLWVDSISSHQYSNIVNETIWDEIIVVVKGGNAIRNVRVLQVMWLLLRFQFLNLIRRRIIIYLSVSLCRVFLWPGQSNLILELVMRALKDEITNVQDAVSFQLPVGLLLQRTSRRKPVECAEYAKVSAAAAQWESNVSCGNYSMTL